MSGKISADEIVSDEAAAIVSAALMHIPFDGWTEEALVAGAIDAGIHVERVSVCFPSGPMYLSGFLSADCGIYFPLTFAARSLSAFPHVPDDLVTNELTLASAHCTCVAPGL